MSNISFTFYPENWWASDAFEELDPLNGERYIYLECLFKMYNKGGRISSEKKRMDFSLRTVIPDAVWAAVTDRLEVDHDTKTMTSQTVIKRLNKAQQSRDNGAQSPGRPARLTQQVNPEKKPRLTQPPNLTTKPSPLGKESKSKSKSKRVLSRDGAPAKRAQGPSVPTHLDSSVRDSGSKNSAAGSEPEPPTRPYAGAGLRQGSSPEEVVKMYGFVNSVLNRESVDSETLLRTFLFAYPRELDEEQIEKVRRYFSDVPISEQSDTVYGLLNALRDGDLDKPIWGKLDKFL